MKKVRTPLPKTRTGGFRNRKASQPATTVGKTNTLDSTLSALLRILAVIGIVLSFFGYFVAAGVASSTRQDLGTLITGPLDLFYFETVGFASIIGHIKLTQSQFFVELVKNTWLLTILIAAGIFVFLSAYKNQSAMLRRRKRAEEWIKYCKLRLQKHITARLAFSVVTSLVVVPVIGLLGEVMLLFGLAVIFIPMLVGMRAGQLDVNENVSVSKSCTPLTAKEGDRQEPYVLCSRISWQTSSGTYSEAGRVIASTGNYILLYNPNSKQFKRIGITGQTTIENIGSIDKPTK